MVDAQRRLAAIVAIDVAGYSRLMGRDEQGTLARLKEHRVATDPIGQSHGGRIVGTAGDGLLVEFPSVVEAVACGIEIQALMAERNAGLPDDDKMLYRIGINLGDVLVDGEEIYGDGVNVAARLEELAEPGGICVSRAARDQVRDRLDVAFADLGEVAVKNIARPVRVFRVQLEGRDTAPDPEPEKASRDQPAALSIAVLPFANLSDDKEQEYFADGMTDDLITHLSKVDELFVIARNSVFTYKGQNTKVEDVAQDLGVRYVLEGSVRRAGEVVRINAQLIDAESGGHLWAEIFDRELKDIFALQDEVTGEIVLALKLELTPDQQRTLAQPPTRDQVAHDLFMKGREAYHRHDPQVIFEALEYFKQAYEHDPSYTEAYAWRAATAHRIHNAGYHTKELSNAGAAELSRSMVAEALRLDPANALALSVRAGIIQWTGGDHTHALGVARAAVEADPNDVGVRARVASVFAFADWPQEAREQIAALLRLSPRQDAGLAAAIGGVHVFDGDYQESVRYLEQARDSLRGYSWLRALLAMAYARLGRMAEAEVALKGYMELENRQALMNWRWLGVWFQNMAPGVRARVLESLSMAGLPEWPFGFEGVPDDRLTGDQIRDLVFGRTRIGKTHHGSFELYTGADGRLEFHQGAVTLFGRNWIEDDALCFAYPEFAFGRTLRGYVYHVPDGAYETRNEYVFVHPLGLTHFSIKR